MTEPTDTRQRILAVAERRFVEFGYDGTSLREIAEDLGFTKAALYYHFPSKADILQELLAPMVEVFEGTALRLEAVRGSDRPVERWAEVLEELVHQVKVHRALWALVERNRQVVEAMFAASSELFKMHQASHSLIDQVLLDLDLPIRTRVRMVCALGAVTGFDDWAPALFNVLDEDVLASELIAMIHLLLDLPADPAAG